MFKTGEFTIGNAARYSIAKGNTTLLVEGFRGRIDNNESSQDSLQRDRANFAKQILARNLAEQVGFVDATAEIPTLEMMGRELCVNGLLAFAWSLDTTRGSIKTSGLAKPADFNKTRTSTSVSLEIPFTRPTEDIVLLGGIGYRRVDRFPEMSPAPLKSLAREYGVPAFGYLVYDGFIMTPYVYVQGTNSLIPETACGAGSIALKILTGESNIKQPSWSNISVIGPSTNNRFTVTANVVKIRE